MFCKRCFRSMRLRCIDNSVYPIGDDNAPERCTPAELGISGRSKDSAQSEPSVSDNGDGKKDVKLPRKSIYSGGEGLDLILRARDDGQGWFGASDYWIETIFAYNGRAFPAWLMCWYLAYSSFATLLIILTVPDYTESAIMRGLTTPLQNVGYALFLLLTFRTQAVYDRWWEGRKQLGSVNCSTRDLARLCVAHFRDDPEIAEGIIKWTLVFVVAVKCTLRQEQEVEDFVEVTDLIRTEEFKELMAATHKPSYCSWRISTLLASCGRSHREEEGMWPSQIIALAETAIGSMVAAASACERIKNTPMPFAIVVHLRSFLILWLMAIPFVFVASLRWFTIGFCGIVGYALLGFEKFGIEIESPFGRDFNDLPVDKISQGIRANLLEAIEFMRTTDETGAVVSRPKLAEIGARRRSVHIDVWNIPETEPNSDFTDAV